MVKLTQKQRIVFASVLVLALLFLQMAPAYADSIDTGLNNILKLVGKIVAICLVAAGILAVFRGQVAAAIGMVFVGALLIAIASQPEVLKGLGDAVFALFK